MQKHTQPLIAITLAATLVAFTAAAQAPKQITVRNMPASVVKTVPPAGATDVDPALKELSFTFSKDMTDHSWSASQISDETYPKSGDGEMHYLPDKRTCVMPVKLEPGKTYVIWLNTGKFHGFQDTSHYPSVPYLLVFQTRK
jgi:RNA polymerase sigma-70 factor (ECF subfamily)